MPRGRRIFSNSGYYHIMLRGNERKNIFHDDQDKRHFLGVLNSKKENSSYYLHAFCLMNNHVHLMLSKGKEEIPVIMKRINVSYVYYFNNKYNRVGHLYQDRYKSEIVEDDTYALCLARYIHQNPVKAGLVKDLDSYYWSSYNSYVNDKNEWTQLIDKKTILGLFSENRSTALKEFVRFMSEDGDESFIDLMEDDTEILDNKSALEIFNNLKKQYSLNSGSIDNLIKEFKNKTNLSVRKISLISGIHRNRIDRILKSK